MKSISLLKRRLKTIERHLPKGDVEFELYLDGDEIPDDGTPVLVIDLLAAIG